MIKEQLDVEFKLARLKNAYLVSSQNPVSAYEEICEFVAKTLFVTSKADDHPDFLSIGKLDSSKKSILLEQIKNLQEFFAKTSIVSGYKVAIIYGAEYMNLNSSNACLKILEDTPQKSHVFLITSNPAMILATIRSRCAKIRDSGFLSDGDLPVEDYYIKPFLKTTKIAGHEHYLKEFAGRNLDAWSDFAANVQKLTTRIARFLSGDNLQLSTMEMELTKELHPITPQQFTEKSASICKIFADTEKLDLDLRASYIALLSKFC